MRDREMRDREMRDAITFTVCIRPWYMEETLAAWKKVRGVKDWTVYFNIESTSQSEIQAKLCQEFADWHGDAHVDHNVSRYGVSLNPWRSLNRAFKMGHEFVMLAEEDVLPATDVLEYMEWARTNGHRDVLAVCAWSDEDGPINEARFRKWFNPWLWGTWRDVWVDHLRDTWDLDFSSGDSRGVGGWDANIGHRLVNDLGKYVMFPRASRSKHIGVWVGSNADPNDPTPEPPAWEPDRGMVLWRTPYIGLTVDTPSSTLGKWQRRIDDYRV